MQLQNEGRRRPNRAPSDPTPVGAGAGGRKRREPLRLGSGFPHARTIRRALDALERMPAEAIADLVERLVDKLDVADGDLDLEREVDCCSAGDDNPQLSGSLQGGGWLPGDEVDAEEDDPAEDNGDYTRLPYNGQRLGIGDADDAEAETDRGASEDEPLFFTVSNCQGVRLTPDMALREGG